MNQVRIEWLIERYLNGVLTEPERAELEQQLLSTPSARSAFWEQTQFHALIRRWGQESWGRQLAAQAVAGEVPEPKTVVDLPAASGWRLRWWQPVAAAAALLVLAAGGFWLAQRGTPEASGSAPAVAVLKRSAGVQWTSRKDARSVGQLLAADWLRWRAGTVQIDFLSGASLIVAGPAEVRLEGENSAFLQRGEASVYVPPPARGFVLRGAALDVTDLGTAFGMSVASNRPPELHVFEGAVTFAIPGGPDAPRRIEAGHAMRIEASSAVEIPVREKDFPNLLELMRRATEEGRAHAAVWLNALSRLAGEPGALLCYSFENLPGWSRGVTNLAANAQAGSPGTVVSAGWIGGRWAGTRALEYRSSGDRLRFDVPGAHGALTLMAWARVDSLPNDVQRLDFARALPEGVFPLDPGTEWIPAICHSAGYASCQRLQRLGGGFERPGGVGHGRRALGVSGHHLRRDFRRGGALLRWTGRGAGGAQEPYAGGFGSRFVWQLGCRPLEAGQRLGQGSTGKSEGSQFRRPAR